MPTPLITYDLYLAAMENGYYINIGWMSPELKRKMEGDARKGTVAKCRGYWPNLMHGTSGLKTIYVFLGKAA